MKVVVWFFIFFRLNKSLTGVRKVGRDPPTPRNKTFWGEDYLHFFTLIEKKSVVVKFTIFFSQDFWKISRPKGKKSFEQKNGRSFFGVPPSRLPMVSCLEEIIRGSSGDVRFATARSRIELKAGKRSKKQVNMLSGKNRAPWPGHYQARPLSWKLFAGRTRIGVDKNR